MELWNPKRSPNRQEKLLRGMKLARVPVSVKENNNQTLIYGYLNVCSYIYYWFKKNTKHHTIGDKEEKKGRFADIDIKKRFLSRKSSRFWFSELFEQKWWVWTFCLSNQQQKVSL